MPSETDEKFKEPTGEDNYAGTNEVLRPATPFIKFITEENVPIHRGIGFRDVRELELGYWARMQANGAYLRLDGLDNIKSMYVLEIPPQGATSNERHIYHEFYLVIEGRGTTETWRTDGARHTVEWRPGSYFMIPPNIDHRLVNATNERVLLLATTNLPPIMNIFRTREFVYENDAPMSPAFDDPEFYKYDETLYAEQFNKRAQVRTNFYPDIINCELPLDNQRAPGYRRITPGWTGLEDLQGTPLQGFIAQYPTGRYSRGHRHGPRAVLVCLRGKGYSFNWHQDLGTTPWKDGNGDQVIVQDYVPGGLVAAAPGGDTWFHQHFGSSRDSLRVLNYMHGPSPIPNPDLYAGDEGEKFKIGNLTLSKGGRSIGYAEEDPHVREMFEAALAEDGLKSDMPPEIYTKDV